MAQKVIVILNSEVDEELNVDGIKYALEQEGYNVELVEDTLQKNNYGFQPLAYALQEDAEMALENAGHEATPKLIDVLSRGVVEDENLQDAIAAAMYAEIEEGFDEDDLSDDEDEEE